MKTQIIILDYGSQYTQLLARRIRELNVYAEVISFQTNVNELRKYHNLKGIILSGGPASVYAKDAYTIDKEIFNLNLPILGVCYGMQLITEIFGGKIELADSQEFGKTTLYLDSYLDNKENQLFTNVRNKSQVWMSHADHLTIMPKNFIQLAHSDASIAAIANIKRNIYGIQFHAEVTHSEFGTQIIENFLFKITKCNKDWTMKEFIKEKITDIKATVGNEQVILGLSGGVDSSVTAVLIAKAIGKQLTCIFVDTGLLRKNETKKVMDIYAKEFDINIKLIDASEQFYSTLKGVTEPEKKRKIIGHNFIEIFSAEAKKLNNVKFLAQGTIYSDVIESSAKNHSSKVIKSHHNVGGLPENLNFKLLEPLRNLFKDEVRQVGKELAIPDVMINRHPFPGPGLAIRVIGEVTKEKCDILKEADNIFINKLIKENLYDKVSQAFVTLLPVKTVGVMGDNRTYDYLVALRCIETIDFMTATTTHLPWNFLEEVVNEIINKVKKINRVVYDITSKPPGTIEWE
ncbi:MAG: glutamine-hydrolyzing GMP synthase [Spiroplasma sp.]